MEAQRLALIVFFLTLLAVPAGAATDWPLAISSECDLIATNVHGPEDIEFLNDGSLLVSATDRRADPQLGALCIVNPDSVTQPRNCVRLSYSKGTTAAVAPHGIYLFGDERRQVAVVDHVALKKTRVLHYVLNPSLTELTLVRLWPVAAGNDVVVDAANRFIVSMPPGEEASLWEQFMVLLGIKRSGLSRFSSDGDAESICGRSRYPNGIALDDTHNLYMADTLAGRVYVREPSQVDGIRQRCWAISSVKGADNINRSRSGRFDGITIAGHPNLFAFRRHSQQAESCSPTEVHALDFASRKRQTILNLSGDEQHSVAGVDDLKLPFCAGSSAVLVKDFLYVGQVFGNGILRCPVWFRSDTND